MENPYPTSVLSKILQKYKLAEPEIQALKTVLSLEGMQSAIEQEIIDPSALVKQLMTELDRYLVIPESAAKELVKLFQHLKSNPIITSKHVKVSDLIFWPTFKNQIPPYIPSTITAELLLAAPENITNLKEFIQANAEPFKVWSDLCADIRDLNNLLSSQLHERRKRASELSKKLLKPEIARPLLAVNRNEIIGNEYILLTSYLSQQLNANVEQLEQTSKSFFTEYFKNNKKQIENPETDVEFFNKQSGKQLGRIMKIKYKDLTDNHIKVIQYFIKTHEGGSTTTSGSTKPVESQELFIYKVLELLGYGLKVHFYFNQLSNAGFYIATQDAGFTKDANKKNKFFATYQELQPELESMEKDGFSNDTKKGIISIDIISRLFVLMDVATNYTNFGRVKLDNKQKWKILDFNMRWIASADTNIFEDFKAGNGAYNYTDYVGKIVRETNLTEKIALGGHIIDELEHGKQRQNSSEKKLSFVEAIDQAFIFVFNYIKKHHRALKIDLVTALGGLKDINENEVLSQLHDLPHSQLGVLARYMICVKQNFILLAQGIRSYQPDNPSLSSAQSDILKPP